MLGKEMLGKEMLDQERDEPKRCSLEPLRLRITTPAFLGSHPKLDCFGGITPLQRLEELGLQRLEELGLQRLEELGLTLLQQITPLQRLEELGITPAFLGSHPILDCFGGITPRLEELGITPAFLGSHPKLDCFGGLHYAYKENIEEVFPWMLDGVWVDSFSIQIPESIQELKKALSVLPQLSSHPKPGCLGGLFSSFDKFLQRIIPGYQQVLTKKVEERSWRVAQLNILPEVRFQGHFETCVFFAVIGAVEGRYRLHMIRNDPDHATVPQFSVQDAIDGIKEVPIHPATCFNWIIKQGVVPESDCPYIGVPQGGHALKEGRLSVVNSYRNINLGGECAEGIVKEIMEGGPIVGVISYSGFLHAVMLIGGVYKDDRVDEYVIQNSWGTGWEVDGRGLVPISYLVGAYVPVLG